MNAMPPNYPAPPTLTKAEKATLALLGRALARGGSDRRSTSNEYPRDILVRLQALGLCGSVSESGSITLSAQGAEMAIDFFSRHLEPEDKKVATLSVPTPDSVSTQAMAIADLPESLQSVLAENTAGPTSGLFTDGGARPNPGPGGWGVVYVQNNQILAQRCGYDPDTTNNRMELTALIEAYGLLPQDARVTIHSDSNLCVQTVNEWAASWKRRGWKKKDGEIKNLDLVQKLYARAEEHPHVTLIWVKAHNGWRWNEYTDALASAWTRSEKIPQFG